MTGSVAIVAPEDEGPVSRQIPEPLRDQVARVLRAAIRGGEHAGRLPTETELADRFRVGRKTVRHALAILADEGLVRPLHGVGWFVVYREPERSS